MKNCKYCNAELVEPSLICPQCGKDNAETQPAETPAKLSAGKSVLAVAAMVAAIILLIAVALYSQKPEETAEETAAVETEAETIAATIPADGNPEDVTCKGTYYADDAAVIAARDTVIATAGDQELTIGQLQVYYWMEVRNFLTQYGAYAAYFGLDAQQSLDTQVCGVSETPMTWQQFFLNGALQKWSSYGPVSAAAVVDGFELPESQQNTLDNLAQEMDAVALENGFTSGLDMVHTSLGAAAELEDYGRFMEQYARANGYYNVLAGAVTYTDDDLSAFFDAHTDDYAQAGVTKDSIFVNVRHILVYPEGADGGNVATEEFSEEAWSAGEAKAQALLDEWLAGDMTEESFAALANANSQDPGSNTNGGLYTDVTVGEMVQTFNDWCFDPARQVGDTGIVRTEYGFHVMYFSGSRPQWIDYARQDYVTDKATAQVETIRAESPMTVDYAQILLCNQELN